jgi:hypothetical protein
LNRSVLTPLRLCPSNRTSTLRVAVYGFRAKAPGDGVLEAPLRRAWQGRSKAVVPYRARVVVRAR